jgi:hypothetical protein
MKHAYIISVCLLMLAGVACKKRNSIPSNELHFAETQCANPWARMTTQVVPQSDTESIKNWLSENNITALKIEITVKKDIVTCEACHCPSGRTVKVLFNTADLEKAKSLGFYKP